MIAISFWGYESDKPVIPLAYACGTGTDHAYPHRMNAVARLCDAAPSLWRATSLEEADVLVYPHKYDDVDGARDAVKRAAERDLPILFFHHDDSPPRSVPAAGILYCTSLDSSSVPLGVRAMSGLSDDMLAGRGGNVLERPWQAEPAVGFCGNASSPLRDLLDGIRRRTQTLAGTHLRRRAMDALRTSGGLQTDFVLRKRYWGGAVTQRKSRLAIDNGSALRSLRDEFIRNMLETDYTLCVRGAGNYSIRFYETLSVGRVPLFVDSRCVLPFEETLDWRSHCVFVDQSDVAHAGELLKQFHARHAGRAFVELQQRNRRLWVEWLETAAFYERVLRRSIDSHEHRNDPRKQ